MMNGMERAQLSFLPSFNIAISNSNAISVFKSTEIGRPQGNPHSTLARNSWQSGHHEARFKRLQMIAISSFKRRVPNLREQGGERA
jgi:hypothetical protein